MKITYYGHSCFGIEINETYILIDPFITGNPLASNIDVNEIKADYILLTHAHQDHVLDVEVIAERTAATIISNYEIVQYYEAKKLKGHPVNWRYCCYNGYDANSYGCRISGFSLSNRR